MPTLNPRVKETQPYSLRLQVVATRELRLKIGTTAGILSRGLLKISSLHCRFSSRK